jgi:excisionase family DNA binding protein
MNPLSSLNQARLINIRQASQFLSVSVSTLYGWVWQRRIPFIKVGRAVRFDIQDLEKFIHSSRHAVR